MKNLFLVPAALTAILLAPLEALLGATLNAASPNLNDVVSAINSAAAGDTVVVPAGTATWSSGISISKALTLQGAGMEETKIVRSSSYSGAMITIAGASGDPFIRVTGFYIDNVVIKPSSDRPCVAIFGPGRAETMDGSWTNIRIDHCYFNAGKRQVYWHYNAFGVMDHCTLRNAGQETAWMVSGNGDPQLRAPPSFGTRNAVYCEDCTFLLDSGYSPGGQTGLTDFDQGGVIVCRHTVFDTSAYKGSNDGPFGSHGSQGYWRDAGSYQGTIQGELTDCVFKMYNGYRFIYLRGGRWIIARNKFSVLSGSMPRGVAMTDEEGYRTDIFNPLRTSWPAEAQLNNCYFWDNEFGGAPQQPGNFGTWNPNDGIFVQKDRDYFLAPPSETVHSPSYPQPGSPPSNSAYPYHLYNPPVTSYRPLAYPHPLVSGGAVPTPTPSPSPTPSPPSPIPTPEPTATPSPPRPTPTPEPFALVRLFSPTPEIAMQSDSKSVELGTQFISDIDGRVVAIRFYKGGPGNGGNHTGALWDASGKQLAAVTFCNETDYGWQEIALDAPVLISAGQAYWVSYHAPNGHYSVSQDFFATAYTNGPLSATRGGYSYGNETKFPATEVSRSYWVDVVFSAP